MEIECGDGIGNRRLSLPERHLEKLIRARMAEYNEKREVAELKVVQTAEGMALWECAREERLSLKPKASLEDQAEVQLEALIERRMSEHGERRDSAEIRVIQTAEGRELWERARKARLKKG